MMAEAKIGPMRHDFTVVHIQNKSAVAGDWSHVGNSLQ